MYSVVKTTSPQNKNASQHVVLNSSAESCLSGCYEVLGSNPVSVRSYVNHTLYYDVDAVAGGTLQILIRPVFPSYVNPYVEHIIDGQSTIGNFAVSFGGMSSNLQGHVFDSIYVVLHCPAGVSATIGKSVLIST